MFRFALAVFALWNAAGFAAAQPQSPVSAAVEAIEAEDWETAELLAQSGDAVTGDVIRWLSYRAEAGAFDEIARFLDARPDWPGLDPIRATAEQAIADGTPHERVLTFFDGNDVETGAGAVAYARALIAAGRPDEAQTLIIGVWTTQGLSEEGHNAVLGAFPDMVAPYHMARADMLLWRWRTDDAARQLPLLDEGQRALVAARIAYIRRDADVSNRFALVPDRLRDDPGLAYDRFNWRAARSDWTLASEILQERSESAEALGVPWRWGSWRRILARWHMREGNAEQAYRLAANHHIAPEDQNYADLEWLAGYIALTYTQDAAAALRHFQSFDAAVTTPISKGRSGYWLGRAYERLGQETEALAAFQAGAAHQTTFYGLLSAERLGLTMDPDLIGGDHFGDWSSGPLLRNDLVRAGLLLLEAGERGAAVLFFREAARVLPRAQIGQLGAMLLAMDEPFYTLLTAKTALREGEWIQDILFSVHPMAEMDLPVDPALALAIARQESEFRVDAGSSVGALGLMQLMPGTARDVAGWLDLPYQRGRLTRDWEYNARLGAEYLAYLERELGSSVVMVAAGYNAGPGRPPVWMDTFGDPRAGLTEDPSVNIVDWVEHIPFRETRNYVMRVSEGAAVYQARLSGQITPVRFTDMLRGAAPVIRPQPRPEQMTRSPRPRARP